VKAYPAFLKAVKHQVPKLHRGFVYLNKFLAADNLLASGLEDIGTHLETYINKEASDEERRTAHNSLVTYLEDPKYFVQDCSRQSGFDTIAYTVTENDDDTRFDIVNNADEIDDTGVSILTVPDAAPIAATESDSEVVGA
jgi:hypothetical protein